MPTLTSVRNERVRRLAGLARRRNRDATGLHLADGPHAVHAALEAGIVEELLVTEQAPREFRDRGDLPVTLVSDNVLAHLAQATSPQGVVAVVRTPHATVDQIVNGRTAVSLERINDPGNLGTIARTAAAMGVHGLALSPGSTDPFGPKVVRAAAGATYGRPIAMDVEPDELAHACHQHGGRLIGLDMRADATIADLDDPAPLVLVAGSEAHGFSDDMRGVLDGTVAIPMPGGSESLNVAIAVALALYERCVRGRGGSAARDY